jgi:hypothetical protein
LTGQFNEQKKAAAFRWPIVQVETACRRFFALPVVAILVILECIAPSVADEAAQEGLEVSGKAILTVGSGTHIRPCREIFLISPADAASLGLDVAVGDHLKMDWEFYDRVGAARTRAKAVTTCASNGSFRLHNAPNGKTFVVARFSWLRGKWSTGGSLIHEIDLPLGQPLELRAHLVQ